MQNIFFSVGKVGRFATGWWRIWAGLLGFVCIVGMLLALLDYLFPPPLGENLEYSMELLDSSASERLRIYTTKNGFWRLPTQVKDLDLRFIRLLLAYEDKRFYAHPGVDVLAMLRAVGQALLSGRFVSGGSTLTMQTVRLLHPRRRTLLAKLIEVLRALQLEYRLSKTQILSLYLTLTPYGGNIQGVRAASWFYFGKEPTFLTLEEAALFVALPQSPEARRPDRHQQRAVRARTTVLQRLTAAGLLDLQDAKHAAALPIPKRRRPTPRLAPHLTDRLRARYPKMQRIRTTIKAQLQRDIEALLARRQELLAPGITLAALIVENRTGAVRAYVGSGAYFATGFPGQVDMVRAVRSPGSTLKPFVYGLAFDAGIAHPETLIFDRPGPVKGYAPGNFDRRYQGELHIRDALLASRNIPAIKVMDRVGASTLLQRLESVGVKLHLPKNIRRPGLPIILGGVGIRLEDQVRLYAGLATAGVAAPSFYGCWRQCQAIPLPPSSVPACYPPLLLGI